MSIIESLSKYIYPVAAAVRPKPFINAVRLAIWQRKFNSGLNIIGNGALLSNDVASEYAVASGDILFAQGIRELEKVLCLP